MAVELLPGSDDQAKAVQKLLASPWDEPFARFDAFIVETDQVLRLIHEGAHLLFRYPALLKPAVLRQVERGLETMERAESRIKHVEQTAIQAQQLIESEYSILRAHMLVGLWGALEALVFNVTVNHLTNRPDLLKSEKLSKVRIPAGLLDEANKEAQMMQVVEEGVQQLRIGLLTGASRFEALLDLVDLSEPLSEELRKGLYEAAQVRNLIVHRTSSVDRRFKEACPWLNAEIGARFDVTETRYNSCFGAIAEYGTLLYERVRRVIN